MSRETNHHHHHQAEDQERAHETGAPSSILVSCPLGPAQLHVQGRQLSGKQRTSAAAQNIKVDDGSAAHIAKTSQAMIEADIEQIRANARREAWGLRMEASLIRKQGRYQKRASYSRAFTSLLSEVSQWYGAASQGGWFSSGGGGGGGQPTYTNGFFSRPVRYGSS